RAADESLNAASSANSVYSAFGSVLGPALAGLLIKFAGLTGAYAIDAVSFVASLVALYGLPRIPPLRDADRPSLRSVLDGFRFVRRQKVILGFFLVDTNAMIFGMPIALFPAVADHRFGDPTLVGYLYSAPAAGAFLATITAGWIPHIGRQGLAVVVASLTSLRFSVVSGGVLCIAGTLATAAAFPALLRYNARSDAAPA